MQYCVCVHLSVHVLTRVAPETTPRINKSWLDTCDAVLRVRALFSTCTHENNENCSYDYITYKRVMTHLYVMQYCACVHSLLHILTRTTRIAPKTTSCINESWIVYMWCSLRIDSRTINSAHAYVTWLSAHICSRRSKHMICDVTHSYVTWLIDMWRASLICDVTHWYVTWLIDMWRDSLIYDVTHWYVTWLIDMWRDSFIRDVTHSYVTWLIHTWHIPHTYVVAGAILALPTAAFYDAGRRLNICDMTHWYVTWLIHAWLITHVCSCRSNTRSTNNSSILLCRQAPHTYVTWPIDMW